MFVHMVSVRCMYSIMSRYTSVNLCFSLCVYQYVCVCLSICNFSMCPLVLVLNM